MTSNQRLRASETDLNSGRKALTGDVSERKREEIRALAEAWHKALVHVMSENVKKTRETKTVQ